MKLARNAFAPAIVLGLLVGFAGCGTKKPPGTNPPGDTGGGDGGAVASGGDGGSGGGASDGGGTSADGGADGGGADGGAANPADCGAKVADTPTLLFEDKVIFRPPSGVEFPPSDGNPTFAQATMGGGFISTCDANIKRVMISVVVAEKKKAPAKLLPDWIKNLEGAGYTGGKVMATNLDTATDAHISVEYPGGGGQEATVLYIAIARRGDTDFVIIYESGIQDFELLKPTYMESAKSLFIVPE